MVTMHCYVLWTMWVILLATVSPLFPTVSAFTHRVRRTPMSGVLPFQHVLANTHHNNRKTHHSSPQHVGGTSLRAVPISVLSTKLHADTFYVLSSVLGLSTAGLSLERSTTAGKALSAPLTTMALALIASNLGAIPFSHAVYDGVNALLVPLAVPLLLFDADLRRVLRDTGSLLTAFLVGTLATVTATLATVALLPRTAHFSVATALCARHIGGALNFVAVAETLRIAPATVSAAICADNVVVALYFAALFALAKEGDETDQLSVAQKPQSETGDVADLPTSEEEAAYAGKMDLSTVTASLTVASTLVTAGRFLSRWLLPAGTSALPVTSTLTVLVATLYPRFFQRLRNTATVLGSLGIQMFFCTSGAAGSLRLVWSQAPGLFAFSGLSLLLHFGVLMLVGKGLVRLPSRQLYLASNANVGGPTTAAAMAQAKKWPRLVVPALLIGIFGYATATGLALALAPLLRRIATGPIP